MGRKASQTIAGSWGIKLGWLVNDKGQVVDWHTVNVADRHFRLVAEPFDAETVTLTDLGFRQKDAPLGNLKHSSPKTWNERMLLETILSLITRVCHLKHVYHRVADYLILPLSYFSALFNLLLSLNYWLEPEAPLSERLLHIAEYAL